MDNEFFETLEERMEEVDFLNWVNWLFGEPHDSEKAKADAEFLSKVSQKSRELRNKQ